MPHDASAAQLKGLIQTISGVDNVQVTQENAGLPWNVSFAIPGGTDPLQLTGDATGLLRGDATDMDLAKALLLADTGLLGADELAAVARLNARGLDDASTAEQIDEVVSWPAQIVQLREARQTLARYDAAKIVSVSYIDSQLSVGFDFTIAGGTSYDLHLLESFLRQLGLPSSVDVEIEGDVDLNGELSLDFALLLDLSDLEDGLTFDDMSVQLNSLSASGQIDANQLVMSLG